MPHSSTIPASVSDPAAPGPAGGGIAVGLSPILVRLSDVAPMVSGFYRLALALPSSSDGRSIRDRAPRSCRLDQPGSLAPDRLRAYLRRRHCLLAFGACLYQRRRRHAAGQHGANLRHHHRLLPVRRTHQPRLCHRPCALAHRRREPGTPEVRRRRTARSPARQSPRDLGGRRLHHLHADRRAPAPSPFGANRDGLFDGDFGALAPALGAAHQPVALAAHTLQPWRPGRACRGQPCRWPGPLCLCTGASPGIALLHDAAHGNGGRRTRRMGDFRRGADLVQTRQCRRHFVGIWICQRAARR